MKTILVPLEESGVLPSILETALIVGQKFNSYIEGLYEQPGLTEVVVAGEGLGVTPPDLVETFQQQEKERAVRAHELFEAFMKEKGVPLAGSGARGAKTGGAAKVRQHTRVSTGRWAGVPAAPPPQAPPPSAAPKPSLPPALPAGDAAAGAAVAALGGAAAATAARGALGVAAS